MGEIENQQLIRNGQINNPDPLICSFYASNGKLMYRNANNQHIDYYYLGGKLVANKKGNTVTYLHSDYLGSTAAESTTSGGVTARMHYQPFGESIEPPKDDVGYTGHKFDTDLGLSYMQARYYDPVIGRFYSNDPVGYTPQNPVMSFNRYLYVNNNPYKYTDPNGEFLHVGIGALIGAIGGAASAALNGGSSKEIWASAGAGAVIGGAAALTGGASLLAVAGTGAATGALSDATAQVIVNFDSDKVDTSSLEAGVESVGSEIVGAISDINLKEVGVSGVLGSFGGVVDKGAKVLKFSATASSAISETTNVLTSAKKDELAQ
jgi:RHS repeat-associated protein